METASSEKPVKARREKIVETVCQGCHVTCGVLVHVNNGKITKIEGNPEHPLSRGMMCPKGLAYKQIVHHPDRLKYPLKRLGERGEDKWQRISWDEALDTIANKFKEVKREFGPESIVSVAGGNPRRNMHATRALMDSIGSPNWSTADAPFCWGPSVAAEHFTYGCHVTQDIGSDCKNSQCVIVWAGNPVNTHPTWARDLMLAKANGARIIVIDPRFTVTASKADIWLQIRPGTDGALALGMMNVVINEELYDREFVDKWCIGFNELKGRVQDYPPEKVAGITWIPADDIKKVARMYATIKPACLYIRVAPEMIFNSTQSIRAMVALLAICGNFDVKGGNVVPCLPPGVLGRLFYRDKAWRLPDDVEEKRLGAKEFPLFCGPRSRFGQFHSPTLIKAIMTEKPYPVKALFVVNNLLLCQPNTNEVYQALKKVDFLLVSEIFMTATAQLADIVIPAPTWLEIEEFVDRYQNFVVPRRRVIEPFGECRDEFRVAYEIARRMGLKFTIWPDIDKPEDFEDFRLKKSAITFEELKQKSYVMEPMQYKKYEKNGFKTPSGKVELYSKTLEEFGYDPLPQYVEPLESPVSTPELAEEYPFILITGGRRLSYIHSLGHQAPWLRELSPEPRVEIHPETAEKLDIKEGDMVWVETPRGGGRIAQKAKLTPALHPRVVHYEAHWWFPELPAAEPSLYGMWDVNVNVVIPNDPPYEDICGTPPLRAMLCKIFKVKED